MKLSSRGKYGLHAMIYLARHASEGPQRLSVIAENGIPAEYLEQLLGKLRRSGLVITTRGAAGGYAIARDPTLISVAEVLEATEGEFSLHPCHMESGCKGGEQCATKRAFAVLTAQMKQLMQALSLADIIDDKELLQ